MFSTAIQFQNLSYDNRGHDVDLSKLQLLMMVKENTFFPCVCVQGNVLVKTMHHHD